MMAYLQENDSVNMPFWIKKKERLGKRMYRKNQEDGINTKISY